MGLEPTYFECKGQPLVHKAIDGKVIVPQLKAHI